MSGRKRKGTRLLQCPICQSWEVNVTHTIPGTDDDFGKMYTQRRKCNDCGVAFKTEIRIVVDTAKELDVERLLLKQGVSRKIAVELRGLFAAAEIKRYVDGLDLIIQKYEAESGQAVKSRPGFLVKAIRDGWDIPSQAEVDRLASEPAGFNEFEGGSPMNNGMPMNGNGAHGPLNGFASPQPTSGAAMNGNGLAPHFASSPQRLYEQILHTTVGQAADKLPYLFLGREGMSLVIGVTEGSAEVAEARWGAALNSQAKVYEAGLGFVFRSSPPADKVRVWQETLGHLEQQMTRATFSRITQAARLLRVTDDGVYVLGVNNAPAKDWLEHRLFDTIQRTLSRVAGESCGLSFELVGEEVAR